MLLYFFQHYATPTTLAAGEFTVGLKTHVLLLENAGKARVCFTAVELSPL